MSKAMRTREYQVAPHIKLVADVGGQGDAPCVILMHGGGQTRYSWIAAGRELIAAGYQVVNFDARGHGESSWAGAGGYSLQKHAEDLHKVVQTIDAPIALVGASLGGATALRALADGMRPAALALVDIVPDPHPDGVRRIRAFMQARPEGYATLDQVADAIAAYNPNRTRPDVTDGLLRNLRKGDHGRYHWHWDPEFLGRDIDVELTELSQTIEGARIASDIPVLLIRGMNSDVIDEKGTAKLRDVLPRMEIYDVEGAGHMVAGDRNDAFNAGLLEFLARHFSPAKQAS